MQINEILGHLNEFLYVLKIAFVILSILLGKCKLNKYLDVSNEAKCREPRRFTDPIWNNYYLSYRRATLFNFDKKKTIKWDIHHDLACVSCNSTRLSVCLYRLRIFFSFMYALGGNVKFFPIFEKTYISPHSYIVQTVWKFYIISLANCRAKHWL